SLLLLPSACPSNLALPFVLHAPPPSRHLLPPCHSHHVFLHLLYSTRRHERSPLFPYTTLFRSNASRRRPSRMDCGAYGRPHAPQDRKSTRLNSSHGSSSYAVFGLKKKKAGDDGGRAGGASAGGNDPAHQRHDAHARSPTRLPRC